MNNLTSEKNVAKDAKRDVAMNQSQESSVAYRLEFKIPELLKKYSRLSIN